MEHRFDPLLVAAGGFVGAVLRYGVDVAVPGVGGTLAVNVLGSFALGALLVVVRRHHVRLLLGTGLLSSFTTYSTFAVQTASLPPRLAVANVAANYVLGLLAVLAGRRVVGGVVA